MTLSNWADIATIAGSLAVIGIAVQVSIAYKQFKADHERGRREKTVDLLIEWDKGLKKEGSLARKIIESLSEEQCREIISQQQVLISSKLNKLLSQFFTENNKLEKNENGDILLSESQSAELRWHTLMYLNALESVLVAWQYTVVDREIIEHQFAYLFRPAHGHEALKEFRIAAGGEDSYPAIEVFANHIKEQRRNKLIEKTAVA